MRVAYLSPVHTVTENGDCRRKMRLSQKTATVAEFGDSRSATVAVFCDSRTIIMCS